MNHLEFSIECGREIDWWESQVPRMFPCSMRGKFLFHNWQILISSTWVFWSQLESEIGSWQSHSSKTFEASNNTG